jgi:hypothetical protein
MATHNISLNLLHFICMLQLQTLDSQSQCCSNGSAIRALLGELDLKDKVGKANLSARLPDNNNNTQ